MLTRCVGMGVLWFLAAIGFAVAPVETWSQRGFRDFSQGTFSGAGQNIYVSARGRVQLINRHDLNGDGHVDIAIANGHAKSEKEDVFIYPNRNGDFHNLDRIALPANGVFATAIAELTGDSRPELVLAQLNNGITPRLNAYVYIGAADGFTPKRRVELPAFLALDVVAADWNADGWTDLAFACKNERNGQIVSTIYWNSKGSFDAARRQDVPGPEWQKLAAVDWDGDGVTDLLAATTTSVQWLRGTMGGLAASRNVADAGGTFAVADWNADRKLDLAVADGKTLKLYLQGSSEKVPSVSWDAANVSSVAPADFDRDGLVDLLVAVRHTSGNEFTNSFILWNDARGLDRRARTPLPTVSASGAAAVDLDGDQFPEAVFSNHHAINDNNIQSFVYWNSGGKFDASRKTMLDTRGASGVTVGDVNGDQRPDLVFSNTNGGAQDGWSPNFVYWGDGTRNYSVGRRTEIPGYYTVGSVQADLDDDGWVDLGFNEGGIWSGRPGTLEGVYLWFGSRDGFLPERRSILSMRVPTGSIRAADLNRDGWLDLIAGAHETGGGDKGGFVIFWGGPDGHSARRTQAFPLGSASRDPLVADLNADGYLDLAATPTDINGLYIYWGNATGYDPSRHQRLGADRIFAHLEAADLNRDGFIDLIAPARKFADRTEGDSLVYYGSAKGFSEETRIGLPTMAAYDPSVADLNKDGWLDIVFPNYSATWSGKRTLPVYIYWGSQAGFQRDNRQELPADAGAASTITDFDGDGWLDLYIASHRRDGSTEEAGKPHTHYANSLIYWNGPDGLRADRRTELPAVGPHAQISVDVGNIMTRELAEVLHLARVEPLAQEREGTPDCLGSGDAPRVVGEDPDPDRRHRRAACPGPLDRAVGT